MKRIRGWIIIIIVLMVGGGGWLINKQTVSKKNNLTSRATTIASVQFVDSLITADGSVVAQNQAKLNFQAGGKLIRLPFKEGDRVRAGQTIAQLDTYILQRQLMVALNNYQLTRDAFDQTQQNAADNVLRSQVAPTYTKTNVDFTKTVDDALRRILNQSQITLDNSVINVELANYALQLSTLISPISGIITHEDVSVAGVNVTPATTFIVADPDSIVFRANVSAANIYYIADGSPVTLILDGLQNKLEGTVTKIYPSKVVLNNGQTFYQVDIVSDDLRKLGKLDEMGRAIIKTNSENVALVPAWTVIGGGYIWTNNKGVCELKKVTVGKIHGDQMEVLSGLNPGDEIIIDPQLISNQQYSYL